MRQPLRIATRKSKLALWQAQHVAEQLRQAHPGLDVRLNPMTTSGDRAQHARLATLGGKGLFVKELEHALLQGEADIAVHSMKDVPTELPEEMCVAAVLQRADPRDAFVSTRFDSLRELPARARVGTCSLRRQCQLKHQYPAIDILPLRGNVDTRLEKLRVGDYDAIILASAGLTRLGLTDRITGYLSTDDCLPAIDQGVIGIECRREHQSVQALLAPLEDNATRVCLTAERSLARKLQGSCHSPIAALARLEQSRLRLRGLVGLPDGSRIVDGSVVGDVGAAEQLGVRLGQDLLDRGAADILRELDEG